MKRLTLACAALSFVLLAPTAFADDPTPRVDKRQDYQRDRIEHGIRNGSLTRPEVSGLVKGQRHVRRMERRALSDGAVTGKERVRIEHAQDRQSRRIFRQKHDGQTRRTRPRY